MAISGQKFVNIGVQNQSSNSDSLYIAFNKIQDNFSNLFAKSSPYNAFAGNIGISTETNEVTGTVSITNTGVTKLTPGTGITLSGSNGEVVVSVSGNVTGNLVAGVTRVGVLSNSLLIENSPVVSSGNINIEMPKTGVTAGLYTAPTVTVDDYGRITNITNTISTGTVTSVAVSPGRGIAVSGGPITSNGTITIVNTGVTRLTAGTGITLSGSNGAVTISAGITRDMGTVTSVGISSNTLSIAGGRISTSGNINVELPDNLTITGNIDSRNLIWDEANSTVIANGAFQSAVQTILGNVGNIRITGGTNGQILQTDGTGNLNWTNPTIPDAIAPNLTGYATESYVVSAIANSIANIPTPVIVATPVSNTSPSIVPSGANTQIQFNDGGTFGGNSGLTYNKTTGVFAATALSGNGSRITQIPAANITGVMNSLSVMNTATINGSVLIGESITASGFNINGSGSLTGGLSVTGYISALKPATGTNNSQVATTSFVSEAFNNFDNNKANINSPSLTGIPTAPTANPSGAGTNQIATTEYVKSVVSGISTSPSGGSAIPSGVIVMWSGSTVNIPSGWRLCDGTNGTPNLRDRFVLGAGGAYPINSTGGSTNSVVVQHSHTATSTFNGYDLPTHTHTVADSGHTHTVNDPGHNHAVIDPGHSHNITNGTSVVRDGSPRERADGGSKNLHVDDLSIQSNTTGIEINRQSAGISINRQSIGVTIGPSSAGKSNGTVNTSIDTAGQTGINANMPPYYSLCFIMKS